MPSSFSAAGHTAGMITAGADRVGTGADIPGVEALAGAAASAGTTGITVAATGVRSTGVRSTAADIVRAMATAACIAQAMAAVAAVIVQATAAAADTVQATVAAVADIVRATAAADIAAAAVIEAATSGKLTRSKAGPGGLSGVPGEKLPWDRSRFQALGHEMPLTALKSLRADLSVAPRQVCIGDRRRVAKAARIHCRGRAAFFSRPGVSLKNCRSASTKPVCRDTFASE
jgi:hypothetical protein